jgi:hypothetical protein
MSVDFQEAADLGAAVQLKWDSTYNDGYSFRVTGSLASPVWHIYKHTGFSQTWDRAVGGPSISTGVHTVRAVYDGGFLGLWYDGALIVSTWDN